MFDHGEQEATILSNFEILGCDSGVSSIQINSASPSLVNLTFKRDQDGDTGSSTLYISGASAVTVTSCSFNANAAEVGGAVSISGEGDDTRTIMFQRCSWKHNRATNGGAVHVQSARVRFEECFFSNNEASFEAAAVALSQGSVATFDECVATSNTAEGLTSTIGGFAVLRDKSTLFWSGGHVNQSKASMGGVFYVATGSSVSVSRSLMQSNQAENGGVFFVNGDFDSIVSILDSSFEGNTVTQEGGAVFISQAELHVQNTTFLLQSALRGGAIWNLRSLLNISSCSFESCFSREVGGALNIENAETVMVSNTGFLHCNSSIGGAIAAKFVGNINLLNSVFDHSVAQTKGGAISMRTSMLTIDGGRFTANEAQTGGAIFADFTGIKMTNANISLNNARTGGFMTASSSKVTVHACSLHGNEASESGGAFYVSLCSGFHQESAVEVQGSVFSDNQALVSGGSMVLQGCNLLVSESQFQAERARTRNGGSIYFSGSDQSIFNNSHWSHCEAKNGAAIYGEITQQFSVSNSVLEHNRGSFSGALHIFDIAAVEIEHTEMVSNTAAAGSGGGIRFGDIVGAAALTQHSMTIRDTAFVSNVAFKSGGALSVDTGTRTPVSLYGVSFRGNDASAGGGYYSFHDGNSSAFQYDKLDTSANNTPTLEATNPISFKVAEKSTSILPIGMPVSNLQLVTMDAFGNPASLDESTVCTVQIGSDAMSLASPMEEIASRGRVSFDRMIVKSEIVSDEMFEVSMTFFCACLTMARGKNMDILLPCNTG